MKKEDDRLSPAAQATAERLIHESEEELLVRLGFDLSERGIARVSRDEAKRLAREWLKKQRSEIRRAICADAKIKDLYRQMHAKQTRVVLIAGMADLIAAVTIGVSPFVVAALVVKEGLESFCSTFEGW